MRSAVIPLLAGLLSSACAPVHPGPIQATYSPYTQLREASIDWVAELATTSNSIAQDDLYERATENVRSLLKDPSSAEFRNLRLKSFRDGTVVCGEVNAKNSFGGYVGFTPFVAGAGGAMLYEESEYPEIERAGNAGLLAACA